MVTLSITDATQQAAEVQAHLETAVIGGNLAEVKQLVNVQVNRETCGEDGKTALRHAAEGGPQAVLGFLVRAGAPASAADEVDPAPVLSAVCGGHAAVLQRLIDAEAMVNLATQDGTTPLHVAAECGSVDIALRLLCARASVDARGPGPPSVTANTGSCAPLHYAALCGHVSMAKLLIDHRGDAGACEQGHCTPLHAAAFRGHQSLCTYLAEYTDVNAQTSVGDTVLHMAARHGHDSLCTYLAELSEIDVQNKDCKTALHLAAKWGLSRTVSRLLHARASANTLDADSHTPLHQAAISGHREVAGQLCAGKASVNARTNRGMLPISLARRHRDALLLEQLSVGGQKCRTQLGVATPQQSGKQMGLPGRATIGSSRMPQQCHEAGALASAADEVDPASVLRAVRGGHATVLQRLIDAAALVNLATEDGTTPLHVAAESGSFDIALRLVRARANVDARGPGPASVAADTGSCTPLHYAAFWGHVSMAKLLVNHRSDAGARDRVLHCTPLHAAALRGHQSLCTYLAESADVNAQTNVGDTPLLWAACNGHREVVGQLCAGNASVNVRNHQGMLPISCARGHGVALLLEQLSAGGQKRRTQLGVAAAQQSGKQMGLPGRATVGSYRMPQQCHEVAAVAAAPQKHPQAAPLRGSTSHAPLRGRRLALLLGDSLTHGASQQGGWHWLLRKRCKGLDMRNHGCCGDNSKDGLSKVRLALRSATVASKPLLATVWFGANDAADSRINPWQHIPLPAFKRNLATIVQTVKARFRHVILLAPPPVHVPTYRMVFWKMHYGPATPGQAMDRSPALTEAYAAAVGEIAEAAGGQASGVYFIDVWRRMVEAKPPPTTGTETRRRFLCDGVPLEQLPEVDFKADDKEPWKVFLLDGLHFSPAGEQFIFQLLLETIQRECPEVLEAAD